MHNDAETGTYYFTTSKNVKYVCGFRDVTKTLSPLIGIYDIEIYDFDFYPESYIEGKDRFDEAIGITICDLFTRFFSSDLRALVYVCDSSDKRQKERHRLFNIWHNKYVAAHINRIPIEISIEDEILCGCALITHKFPYMDVLQSEFIDKVEEIMMGKYGI